MIDLKFDQWDDPATRSQVHRVTMNGISEIREKHRYNTYDPKPLSREEIQGKLLKGISNEMTGGIRDTLEHTLRSLSAVRGASEECDKALTIAQNELNSAIQLLYSGMHLLRVDKMLGGSGD